MIRTCYIRLHCLKHYFTMYNSPVIPFTSYLLVFTIYSKSFLHPLIYSKVETHTHRPQEKSTSQALKQETDKTTRRTSIDN